MVDKKRLVELAQMMTTEWTAYIKYYHEDDIIEICQRVHEEEDYQEFGGLAHMDARESAVLEATNYSAHVYDTLLLRRIPHTGDAAILGRLGEITAEMIDYRLSVWNIVMAEIDRVIAEQQGW